MDWARILAYDTGTVDQELLARNEYLAAENRFLKAQLKGRLKLSDTERARMVKILVRDFSGHSRHLSMVTLYLRHRSGRPAASGRGNRAPPVFPAVSIF